MHQEYLDILNIVQNNPGIKSAEICEKMEAIGYYANQRQPTEHVAKRLGYLKNNGHIIGEKMSTPTGPKNHWTIAPRSTETVTERDTSTVDWIQPPQKPIGPYLKHETEIASDIAELTVTPTSDDSLEQPFNFSWLPERPILRGYIRLIDKLAESDFLKESSRDRLELISLLLDRLEDLAQ